MSEVLTLAEIKARFDAEWVLTEGPQVDEHLDALSGCAVWHGKDRDEVYQRALELRPKHPAFLYAGKMPAGTAIVR